MSDIFHHITLPLYRLVPNITRQNEEVLRRIDSPKINSFWGAALALDYDLL